jgi:type IV pilus assembly protein PilB
MMKVQEFVGDLLIRAGVVDAAGLALALEVQSTHASTLGRALAGLGIADESVVATTIASALHLEYLGGEPPDVTDAVAAMLPVAFCRKRGAAPLAFDGKRLRLAVTNPMDDSVLRDVEFRTGKKAVAIVVTESWLEKLFDRLYPVAPLSSYDMLQTVDPAGQIEATSEAEYDLVDPASLAKDVQLPPIVRLVNLLLSDAAKAGASDVHIEPHELQLQIRQRVDGLLHDVLAIPHHLQDATISRLKIISGMDISERRKPQDGRSRLRFEGRRIDLRVSTMPTQFGEKVVIRLLNADKAVAGIDQIGLSPENLGLLRSFLSRPQGMILLTGPTGSGKTSTLYSCIRELNNGETNISAVEDPIGGLGFGGLGSGGLLRSGRMQPHRFGQAQQRERVWGIVAFMRDRDQLVFQPQLVDDFGSAGEQGCDPHHQPRAHNFKATVEGVGRHQEHRRGHQRRDAPAGKDPVVNLD